MKPETSYSTTSSTDEFASGAFRPHGRLDVRIEGAFVLADAYGPFNSEFVKAVAHTLDKLRMSTALPRPYVDVLVFHGSVLASQEMLDQLSVMLGRMPRGDVASALAVVAGPDLEGREFMLPLFERVFRQNGRNFRAFDNLRDARAWAEQCLKADGG